MVEENVYALILATFKNINATDAIMWVKYGIQTKHFIKNIDIDREPYEEEIKRKNYPETCSKIFTEKDYQELLELRKKHTWVELGRMFGISHGALHSKVTRYKRKRDIADKKNEALSTISLNKKSINIIA